MNCPVCNKQLEQGTNFCPNCGFNFRTNKSYPSQSSDTATKILKLILIMIAGFFFLIIIAGGIAFYITTDKMTSDDTDELKGLVMLQEGEIGTEINTKSLKIIEMKTPNTALAVIADEELPSGKYIYGITDVLYIAPENERLFEGQIINIPDGKKLMQVGTFKNYSGTLAAVEIK